MVHLVRLQPQCRTPHCTRGELGLSVVWHLFSVDATQVRSKPCSNWCAFSTSPLDLGSHKVAFPSRPFRLVSPASPQSSMLALLVCNKDGPLQTPRLQALDDDLDWRLGRSFLCDRSCLRCSRLFFAKREHHQHVVSRPERRAVQPISRCHDISLLSLPDVPPVRDQSLRKDSSSETEGAPACAAGAPPCHHTFLAVLTAALALATQIDWMNWLLLVPAHQQDPVPQLEILAPRDSFSLRPRSTRPALNQHSFLLWAKALSVVDAR